MATKKTLVKKDNKLYLLFSTDEIINSVDKLIEEANDCSSSFSKDLNGAMSDFDEDYKYNIVIEVTGYKVLSDRPIKRTEDLIDITKELK